MRELPLMDIINWKLIANPVNWLIIFLTLYFVALLAKILYTAATTGQSPIPLPALLSASS